MEWFQHMKVGIFTGLCSWLFVWGLNRIYLQFKNLLS